MIVTVADVLKRAEDFERMLAEFYAGLAAHSAREGVRLLTDFMSRHSSRISEVMARLSADQVRRVRSAPLLYEPEVADCRCFQGMNLPPDATAAQVLDVAVTFDECLMRLYRQVLQQDTDPEVRALFEALLRTEEADEITLKKIKAMDYF